MGYLTYALTLTIGQHMQIFGERLKGYFTCFSYLKKLYLHK